MAVPGTIFGINSDSAQKILESVANEPKFQARLLVALHYFAEKFSKLPARVPTSSGTSSVYDPSTNSPPQNRPVRSKTGQIVAGKRTPEVDKAGADEDQIWQKRRAERKVLKEEGRRLAQELNVTYKATNSWKFRGFKCYIQSLRADVAAERKKKRQEAHQDADPNSSLSEKDGDPASRASTISSSDSPPPEAGAFKAAGAAAEKAVVSAAAEKAAEAAEKAAAEAAKKAAAAKAAAAESEVVAKTAAAEKAAVEKVIAAEKAAVRKAAAADWEAVAKTPAAVKAGVEKVIAAAAEREAKRAAAEKAAEQVATKERTKGEKKKKKETRQPRNQKNGQFVAAPPISTTPSAPGREEVHAQEAAEFESVQKAMAAGGKCPWSESELGERFERLKEYEFEKQIRRDQDPNPSLIKGDDNHLYTREEVLASELENVLNPGTGQWVSVRQLRNNFFPPESWIRSSRRS
jgi:hypothetical protein